jgi:squalene-hopene/tetraprenyl-beta-curcumene cyclase
VRVASQIAIVAFASLAGTLTWAEDGKPPAAAIAEPRKEWNPDLAARYLDARAAEWIAWPKSARSHDSNCISCHSSLSYLLARGSLSLRLGEREAPAPAKKLLADIRRRVDAWSEAKPWYAFSPEKIEQSRGTEAVINAFLLCVADATSPLPVLTPGTKTALANLWAIQLTDGANKGGWAWLDFELEPWESKHAAHWGATLAAIGVGIAPGDYAAREETKAQLDALRGRLRAGLEDSSNNLHNRAMLLLASHRLTGVL